MGRGDRRAVRMALALAASLSLRPLSTVQAQCPDGSPPPCGPRAARPAAPAPTSVAVLYFDNISRDTSDAYLAEGLTEQTIAQLGQVERLTVASRFAVRRYRGSEIGDPGAVGRALNVTYLVNGSVQRSGERLRVGVELLRASTGLRVWGERYDRTAGDLLRIQDDIASAVATGIVGRLLPAEQRGMRARTTRDPAAWDLFLRGNFFLARREAATTPRAIAEYEAAVRRDPAFTDALARIAYAYGVALDNEYDVGLPRDTLMARGVATAERALRLDSTSSDAWMARAYLRMAEEPRTFEGVSGLFERAIRLNPRNAEAHHQFGSFLQFVGDTARAAAESRRALQLEPGRAVTWSQLARIALERGDYPAMLRYADSMLAADPGFALGHLQRVNALLLLGDTAAARRGLPELEGDEPFLGPFYAAVIDAEGRRDPPAVLRASLDTLLSLPASPTVSGSIADLAYAAMQAARLGAQDIALDLLERAPTRGARLHFFLRFAPFDSIRADSRFQALFDETRNPGAP